VEQTLMKALWERMLYAHGADLVFSGHVHAYERTLKIFDSQPNPCGTVFVTIGDGGNREGLAQEFFEPKPEWSAYRERSFGHGTVDFVNETHALWMW
jgi:acid phosphatase type 7